MQNNEYWIFTFGVGQAHAHKYVKIYGTYEEARKKMFEAYGDRWAFQYSEKQWQEWCERRPAYFPEETELEVIE